jgi:hypothetical protein
MAFHILKSEVRVSPQFELHYPRLGWLRQKFRLRGHVQQQQQQAVPQTTAMDSLYALALSVMDEHGLD